MDKDEKTVFVASKELAEKIRKIQSELNLSTPGEVISLGLSMLEFAQGRSVEFQEKNRSFKMSRFKKQNQTVIVEDGNS